MMLDDSDDVSCVAVNQDDASVIMQATEVLFDKLQKEAYEVAMVGLSLPPFCGHIFRLNH